MKEILTELKQDYKEDVFLEDTLAKAEFYIPESKLAIEITGRNSFYPSSTKYSNFLNMRVKMLKINNHNMFVAHSWKLEGIMANKDMVKNNLSRAIQDSTEKVKSGATY